jgi:tetratricopeptide (TPR) repeat protein
LPFVEPFGYKTSVKTRGALAFAAALLILLAPSILTAQTTEADLYVAQAIIDLDDRRYDAALENLGKALTLEPEHLEALYYTGIVHMAQNRSAEAIPFLARARARAPTELSVALQLGLAYFANQQYDRAEPLLEEVFKSQPEQDGLGYYVGFMRYRKKDYRGALEAFRAGRTADPEIQQLTRLYTGLALAVQGLSAQAATEVEEALRLAPGTALTGPVERLRDSMVSARQGKRRFSAEVRFGFYYDDNVAVLPDHASDDEEPLVGELRRRDRTSTGELLGIRTQYVWWRTDFWSSSVGYSFFGTYNNDLPSFNVTSHLATLDLTYKTAVAGIPLQAGAQYDFDILFLDEDEFLQRHTGTLFGNVIESDRHLSQVVGRYQRKDFSILIREAPPPEEDRTGDNWLLGVVHFLRFAQDRHFLKGGYQFDYENTRGRNYEYRGNRLLFGGQYTLPWYGIRLKYDLELHLRDYLFANTLLPTPAPGTRRRYDKEFINVVRVELPLPHNLALTAEYQNTNNVSNLALFDYTRNVTSLTLSWSY